MDKKKTTFSRISFNDNANKRGHSGRPKALCRQLRDLRKKRKLERRQQALPAWIRSENGR